MPLDGIGTGMYCFNFKMFVPFHSFKVHLMILTAVNSFN